MNLWETWLVVAAAVHLGFQATVTLLVYPALIDRGRRGAGFAEAHAAHSRRITPLVVLVYGALLPPVVVAAVGLATRWQWGPGLTVAGAVTAFAATALVAAPTHGRLSRGWSDGLGVRLARADVVRLVGAAVCLGGAVGSAGG